MKAIFQDRYGPPDVLEWRDVPVPVAGPGDLLVRVHAAGVDRGVWHLMTGLPYLVRVMGYGLRRPRIPVPGMEVAGRVEAVGDGVEGVRPGDEVFGIREGTFAELALIRGGKFARKPAGLGFEQAAALPVSGMTAPQAVRDDGAVKAGQRVLVIGASGGVGSYAVQISKALGAVVTGFSSGAKADLVRSLGADHVIDYAVEEIDEGGGAPSTSSSTWRATAHSAGSGAPWLQNGPS